ncbi:MAG: hypothetical protein JO132_06465 [Streptosporangiaceae bacterium]|nr:hypothetical protein [Streptosporangiaceae bacterium]
MSLVKRVHLGGTRRAGLILAGLLAVGVATASGTALAASGSGSAGMAGMMRGMPAGSSAKTGFTNGWYDGQTVRFFYSKNYFCRTPPASGASSKCEAGSDYIRTPADTFDPLYVVVPLGFTPPADTLQCPVAGNCIDHPHTIDLSAVLGSGTSDVLLPAHSHVVATDNGGQAEWWNVDVVGVKSLSAWDKIVQAKSDWELMYLQRSDPSQVTGNIATNLFLYFAVLR